MVDQHACPAVSISGADGVGSVMMGSPTVMINNQVACRLGDIVIEKPGLAMGPANPIIMGEMTVMIGEVGMGSVSAGAVSPATAASIFAAMASQPDITFKFPVDGCYARAHLMVQRMQAMGLTPGKAWTFASDPNDPLWVNTPNHPDGKVEWGYHVAPTIKVDDNGVTRDVVVDPSMFDHPVTVDEWKNAQNDRPHVVQTRPGQPPIPSAGGSGYWPAADPREGPDANAHDTMAHDGGIQTLRGYSRTNSVVAVGGLTMGQVMLLALKLVMVVGVQKTSSGSLIVFDTGQGQLLSNNSEYAYYLKLAERSLERKQPVGVGLSGDEIVEMVRADADVVSQLIEDGQKNRLKVFFQGHDGVFTLRYDNPDFARLARVLRTSTQQKQEIWFVAKKPLLDIHDARLVAEKSN